MFFFRFSDFYFKFHNHHVWFSLNGKNKNERYSCLQEKALSREWQNRRSNLSLRTEKHGKKRRWNCIQSIHRFRLISWPWFLCPKKYDGSHFHFWFSHPIQFSIRWERGRSKDRIKKYRDEGQREEETKLGLKRLVFGRNSVSYL